MSSRLENSLPRLSSHVIIVVAIYPPIKGRSCDQNFQFPQLHLIALHCNLPVDPGKRLLPPPPQGSEFFFSFPILQYDEVVLKRK